MHPELRKSITRIFMFGLVFAGLVMSPDPAKAATLDVCTNSCTYSSIQAALNDAASSDTVTVGAGTYAENLSISTDVSIIGSGTASTSIDGGAVGRVIAVPTGVDVIITDLTITNGLVLSTGLPLPNGGGIYNQGTLTLERVDVVGNETADGGGGIYNTGILTITDSTIADNTGMTDGTGNIGGGGIASTGSSASVTITNSSILRNALVDPGTDQRGGGGIASRGGASLAITDSMIADNASGYSAGGIYVDQSGSTLTLTRSTVSGNRTGTARGTGRGAGMAIRSSATATITDSTITGNVSASSGGGIQVDTSLTIENSTISGNQATSAGGGIDADASILLSSVTIVENSAARFGGGIYGFASTIFTSNSIISNNTAGDTGPDCYTTISISDVSLVGTTDTTICVASGAGTLITGVDPQLGPLADNGGPTLTHLPADTSPVVDAGLTALTTDQRGESRPSGSAPDIGSVEVQTGPSPILELLPDWAGLDARILARSQPISGTDCGWAPGETVEFLWDEAIPLTTFTADADGCFEGVVFLNGGDQLGGEPFGTHKITARGQTSSTAAQAAFDLVQQQLHVSPETVGPASPVAITGCGWNGATTVSVYWLATGDLVGRGNVDAAGCIDSTGTIPRVGEGFYALGASAGTVPPDGPGGSSATVIEVRNAYFEMTPTQGPPGIDVDLEGCSWYPGETVSFTWLTTGELLDAFPVGPDGCLTSVVTGPQGAPLVFVEIPLSAPEGDHVIRAEGQLQQVDRTFTVTEPGIILYPVEGPPDTIVSASGCGWDLNGWVDLTWQAQRAGGQSGDYPYLGRADVNPTTGCFGEAGTFTFAVPGDTVGEGTVRVLAKGELGREAEAEFTVLHDGTISVDPDDEEAVLGEIVTVHVRDAIVGEWIDFYWGYSGVLASVGAVSRDFDFDIQIPLDARAESTTLRAEGNKGFYDSIRIEVLNTAEITVLSPQPLLAGGDVTLEGTQFPAGKVVNVILRDSQNISGPVIGQTQVPESATSFTATFDLPLELPPGPRIIAALSEGRHFAYAPVTIASPPFELRAIEVNQAVQDWKNTVDLFADKTTVVRVFLEDRTGASVPATGVLVGYAGQTPLGTIAPLNGPITASADVVADRRILDASLNFLLPDTWTGLGDLDIAFILDPGLTQGMECDEPDESSNCRISVDFVQPIVPEIDFVAIPYWTDEIDGLVFTIPDEDKAPGGTFTLTVDGETTGDISILDVFATDGAAIRFAIRDLSNIDSDEVVVKRIRKKVKKRGNVSLGDDQFGYHVSIRNRTNLPQLTADGTNLTDVSLAVVPVQDGGAFYEPANTTLMEMYERVLTAMPTDTIDTQFRTLPDVFDFLPTTLDVNDALRAYRWLEEITCFGCVGPDLRFSGFMAGSHPYHASAGNSQGLTLASFYGTSTLLSSTAAIRQTAAHEAYHSYGKAHSTVTEWDSNDNDIVDQTRGLCGSVADLDALLHPYVEQIPNVVNGGLKLGSYPDDTWPALGPMSFGPDWEVWGFDTRYADRDLYGLSISSPYETASLMSYCRTSSGQGRWPSKFGYLEVDKGLRLGRVGTPEDPGYVGDVLIVTGSIDESGAIEYEYVTSTQGVLLPDQDSELETDELEFRLLDGSGNEVSRAVTPIDPAYIPDVLPGTDPEDELGGLPTFTVALENPDGIGRTLVVWDVGGERDRLTASHGEPTITLLSPNSDGFAGGSSLPVEWDADDPDGDALTASVLYTNDAGETWRVLAAGISDSDLLVDRSNLLVSGTVQIKVVVSDGFLSAAATSDPFIVDNAGPTVEIIQPTADSVPLARPIVLAAFAIDLEDGMLDTGAIPWESDLDGPLGQGSPLVLAAGLLSPGCHLLTARIKDSDGAVGIATRAFGVGVECEPENAAGTIRIVQEAPLAPTAEFSYTSNIPANDTFGLFDREELAVEAQAGAYQVIQEPADGFQTSVECFDPSGGSRTVSSAGAASIDLDPGETVECRFENTPLNVVPSIAVPSSVSVQHSDAVDPIPVTVTDANTGPGQLTLSAEGLPAGLSLGLLSCVADGPGASCSASITGTVSDSPGEYLVNLTADDWIASETVSLTISVLPEEASVRFHGGNPVAMQVDGDISGTLELMVRVTEMLPDDAEGEAYPGSLLDADVSIVLQPIGPGGDIEAARCDRQLKGTAYDQELTVICGFEGVLIDAYAVVATAGGSYHAVAEDVLVVYDHTSAHVQGGGTFRWPGTDDNVRVAFSMEYNKKGTNVKGGLMFIRTTTEGSTFEVKSNALYGLALSKASDPVSWVSFAGKATYVSPAMAEPEGNHEFLVYVDENDRFWIEVRDKDGNVIGESSLERPGADHAVALSDGGVVIP